MKLKRIGVKNNFFELGGGSLNIMTMLARIQREFGIEIPWEEIIENPTIGKLAQLIETGIFKGDHEKPFIVLNELKPVKIFCFPPQAGYGMIFKRLADFFKNYAIYAFHFIETGDRIEKYMDIITGIQLKGPYIFMGYSAGGNLAFEVAKEMEKKGIHISDIIMLDSFSKNGKRKIDSIDKNKEFYLDLERIIVTMGLEHLKEKVINKAKQYVKYLDNLENQGSVNAKIHLITSINRKEIEKLYSPSTGSIAAASTNDTQINTGWDGLTNNTTTTYNGFGIHANMLTAGFIEKNVAIIQSILTRIENTRSQSGNETPNNT